MRALRAQLDVQDVQNPTVARDPWQKGLGLALEQKRSKAFFAKSFFKLAGSDQNRLKTVLRRLKSVSKANEI